MRSEPSPQGPSLGARRLTSKRDEQTFDGQGLVVVGVVVQVMVVEFGDVAASVAASQPAVEAAVTAESASCAAPGSVEAKSAAAVVTREAAVEAAVATEALCNDKSV